MLNYYQFGGIIMTFNMLTFAFKYVLRVTTTNKNIIRNVALTNTAVNDDVSAATKSWREIPGPTSLPIVGQVHHFLPGGSMYKIKTLDLFASLKKTYGPIVRLDGFAGRPPMIILYDAENSAKVLRGENWLPVRPGLMTLEYYRKKYVKKNEDNPTGLLTEHGESWKRFRSTVNPVMLQPKTIKLYITALDEVAQDMIARMKSLRGEDNNIKSNLDAEMNLWALESIGVVALGDRLNCFDPDLPDDSPARKLIQTIHEFFIIIEKLEFRPSLWRYFSTPAFRKALKIYEDVDNLTKYFIRKSIKIQNKGTKKSDNEKGVLEKLLEIDEQVAFTMAADMLFAGVDTGRQLLKSFPGGPPSAPLYHTHCDEHKLFCNHIKEIVSQPVKYLTANALLFALYLLADNPKKQEKLREEVMSQRDQKPYLKACIKESTRLLPVAFGNFRQTTKEYNLMGYRTPKDMYVIIHHQNMSLSETHFKRASEFIPERWLVTKDDPLYHGNAHPFAHSPFGFGARTCIGRRIAELELETFLAQILKNFKVEWFGPPLKVRKISLSYANGPFNFIFKDI